MSAEVGFPVGGISARAAAQALHAATEAAVRVEQVHELADLRRVIDVVEQVWRTDPSSPVITVEILRALTHAGAYASLAIDSDDGRDLGCCIGFPSLSPPASFHSHIAGVVAAGAGPAHRHARSNWTSGSGPCSVASRRSPGPTIR